MLNCMLRWFVWAALAASLSVACAHSSRVGTDFVPTVPVVRIDVEGGKDPCKSEARAAVLLLEGRSYEARIKVRGSSSTLYPKKQFSLKLRAEGAELDVPLLGMARASSWVLAGPYADKTLIKNVLGLAQARELFPYAPRTRWVELILNDDYHGVYALTEKIERGKDKLAVPSVEEGGFILDVDAGDPPYVESARGTQYTLVYPRKVAASSAKGMDSLVEWLSDFEASLSTEDYRRYVHEESFIDYFLQQELWKNVDGFRKSVYLHRDADQKVHMGPSWDFDLGAAGLAFFGGTDPEGWLHARLDFPWPIDDCVTWFNELLRHPEYRQKVIARWRALREPGALFSDDRIRSMTDDNVQVLSRGPAARNFSRWEVIGRPLFPVLFFTVFPLYDTWEEEVWRSESFLLERAAWIDAHIDGVGEFADDKLTY